MVDLNKTANAFDTFTRTRLVSTILERIWEQAYGIDYAKEARPNAFYPQSVLDAIVNAAAQDVRGKRLVEIGCGHGLAGRYLSERLRAAHHCGIDMSPGSIERARTLARDQSTAQQVESTFWVADAASTGLAVESCAAVVCLDVLLYLTNKAAAMDEIYRVLSPGGLFVFTTWEQEGGINARLGAEQVKDYRPLLTEAGLDVLKYDEVDGWRNMQSQVSRGIIEAYEELKRELGQKTADMWVNMANGGEKEIESRKYVFGIARRPV